MKPRIAGLLASALLITGLGTAELVTASTASALPPYGCSVGHNGIAGWILHCALPPGDTVQVIIDCAHGSVTYAVPGPIDQSSSYAQCNPGDVFTRFDPYSPGIG